jgi:hypothetical protein
MPPSLSHIPHASLSLTHPPHTHRLTAIPPFSLSHVVEVPATRTWRQWSCTLAGGVEGLVRWSRALFGGMEGPAWAPCPDSVDLAQEANMPLILSLSSLGSYMDSSLTLPLSQI